MNEAQAVSALSALAHAQRLRVFRRPGHRRPRRLTPSRVGRATRRGSQRARPYLKELAHAGLVTIEQQGRNLIYRADFSQMNGLLGYLTEHCCQGGVCEVSESSHCDC